MDDKTDIYDENCAGKTPDQQFITGNAGEPLSSGDILISGADGKYYKAEAGNCQHNKGFSFLPPTNYGEDSEPREEFEILYCNVCGKKWHMEDYVEDNYMLSGGFFNWLRRTLKIR